MCLHNDTAISHWGRLLEHPASSLCYPLSAPCVAMLTSHLNSHFSFQKPYLYHTTCSLTNSKQQIQNKTQEYILYVPTKCTSHTGSLKKLIYKCRSQNRSRTQNYQEHTFQLWHANDWNLNTSYLSDANFIADIWIPPTRMDNLGRMQESVIMHS